MNVQKVAKTPKTPKATKGPTAASPFDAYSEQDTADKLILPYFATTHGFPTSSLPFYRRCSPCNRLVRACRPSIASRRDRACRERYP